MKAMKWNQTEAGKAYRKEWTANRKANAGWPDEGLQVLCWNCNTAKYHYGK